MFQSSHFNEIFCVFSVTVALLNLIQNQSILRQGCRAHNPEEGTHNCLGYFCGAQEARHSQRRRNRPSFFRCGGLRKFLGSFFFMQLNTKLNIKTYPTNNRGNYRTPTQTLHYCQSPQNYHTFSLFDSPKIGNLMIPV